MKLKYIKDAPSSNSLIALSALAALSGGVFLLASGQPAVGQEIKQPAAARTPSIAIAKCDEFLATVLRRSVNVKPTGWTSVIVTTESGPLTTERERAITVLGGDIYRRLPLIGATAVRVPTRNLERLADLAFVTHLSLDGNVKKNDEFTVDRSGADDAQCQYGVTGQGVTVAVVDSGINTLHPDLWLNANLDNLLAFVNANFTLAFPSRVLASADFTGAGVGDTCGHGTHVAGIIAGNGLTSSPQFSYHTFYGIARRANLVSVRVLDGNGQGTVSGVIAGINWVVQNKSAYNIRVLNLSLGHPVGDSYKNDPLCQAVEAAYRAGIVVVCAAGNDGRRNNVPTPNTSNEGWGTSYGSIQSPGNDPYVITVGAMKNVDGYRPHDRIATYSSRGPSRIDSVLKPDIVAPGNRIISSMNFDARLVAAYNSTNVVPITSYVCPWTIATWPLYFLSPNSRTYFMLSGTSMASPVVAGAAALLIQRNPTLTPDAVKARLMISADKWVGPDGKGDPCTYGAGYLNIVSALRSTALPRSAVVSPSLARDTNSHKLLLDPSLILWGNVNGTQVIWGGVDPPKDIWDVDGVGSVQTIWGPSAVTDVQIVLGTQVIWGGVLPETPPLDTSPVWNNQSVTGQSISRVDLTSTAINGER